MAFNPSDQARFQQVLSSDPQIQAIISRVWGNTPVNQRPSDTPKSLEQANHDASVQIGHYLQSRGMTLPAHTFVNPRTASLESEHGWAGLPTAAKVGIIGGAAAGGLGLAGALGAFGGAAGAGAAAAPSIGATGGLAAGALPTVAGTAGAAGAGGATAAATAAAAHGLGGLMSGFGVKDAVGLLPGVLSMFGGHGDSTPPQNDAMNSLIGMQTQRLQESDPLYQAILRMAMGLLPVSARGGMGLPGPAAPPAPTAVPRGR